MPSGAYLTFRAMVSLRNSVGIISAVDLIWVMIPLHWSDSSSVLMIGKYGDSVSLTVLIVLGGIGWLLKKEREAAR